MRVFISLGSSTLGDRSDRLVFFYFSVLFSVLSFDACCMFLSFKKYSQFDWLQSDQDEDEKEASRSRARFQRRRHPFIKKKMSDEDQSRFDNITQLTVVLMMSKSIHSRYSL